MSDLTSVHDMVHLPGDPAGLRVSASRYTQMALALQSAASEIRNLTKASDSGLSDAVDALVQVAGDVAGRMERLDERYAVAGSELNTYSWALESAQADAQTAISSRDSAQGEGKTSEWWYYHYEEQVQTASDPVERAEAQRWVNHYRNEMQSAQSNVATAQRLYGTAVSELNAAANRAATAIAQAIDSDGLNDSAWDNFSGWVAEHAEVLKLIKTILGAVTAVLGVLSLFLPILAPLVLVLAGLNAVLSLVLALTGQISWVEFGLDLIAVATAGVVLVAGKALTGTMAMVKSVRVANIARTGNNANPLATVNASIARALPNGPRTLGGTIKRGMEIFSQKGLGNANSLRILDKARSGMGGPLDAQLIALGKGQIAISQGAQAIKSAVSTPALILTQLGGGVGDFVDKHLNGPMEVVGDVINAPGDWYNDVKANSTFRVGSNW